MRFKLPIIITVSLGLVILAGIIYFISVNKLSDKAVPQKSSFRASKQSKLEPSVVPNFHTPSSNPILTPSPTPKPLAMQKPKFAVKGLYLTSGTVGYPSKVRHFVKLANETEINAYVINIKNDNGNLCYESSVPLAKEIGAVKKMYDVKFVLDSFHKAGIYVIGRIVCFNDALMALAKPERAIKKKDGSLFKIKVKEGYLAWLDPSNKKNWVYISDIVKEAKELGFDEIQFDYVRFPETTLYKYDTSYLSEEKYKYINGFLEYIKKQVPNMLYSVDVFGSVILNPPTDAGGIGQTLESIGLKVDYLSPMIYPSHFSNSSPKGYSAGNGVGQSINGIMFTHPDLKPYEVVYQILLKAKKRIAKINGYKAELRPYLQGFTASYLKEGYWQEYGKEQYRQQIQAVYDAGYKSWLFWQSKSEYIESAFKRNSRF